MSVDGDLRDRLVAAAKGEGFPVAGAVDIDRVDLSLHVERYQSWVASGRHGGLGYLERGLDRRADPRALFPAARSVFSVLRPYDARPAGSTNPALGPRYARYLRGQDYHSEVAGALDRTVERVSAEGVRAGLAPLRWKTCVDTSAVLERAWARECGLGWIGKNAMLIHPKLGSYVFIGIVLLDSPVGLGPSPLPDYCGACDRCLQGCPTRAFPEARVLDSRRCVSFLTLEWRGGPPEDPELRRGIGTWVAGCDVCQEVCPFNRRAEKVSELAADFPAPPDSGALLSDWSRLETETDEGYAARVRGSALRRVKARQFRRNFAVALENSGQSSSRDGTP